MAKKRRKAEGELPDDITVIHIAERDPEAVIELWVKLLDMLDQARKLDAEKAAREHAPAPEALRCQP